MDAAFLLTVGSSLTVQLSCLELCCGGLLLIIEAFLLTIEVLLLTIQALLLTVGRWVLISSSTDCKQRRSTVSKKVPTGSEKACPPLLILGGFFFRMDFPPVIPPHQGIRGPKVTRNGGPQIGAPIRCSLTLELGNESAQESVFCKA